MTANQKINRGDRQHQPLGSPQSDVRSGAGCQVGLHALVSDFYHNQYFQLWLGAHYCCQKIKNIYSFESDPLDDMKIPIPTKVTTAPGINPFFAFFLLYYIFSPSILELVDYQFLP